MTCCIRARICCRAENERSTASHIIWRGAWVGGCEGRAHALLLIGSTSTGTPASLMSSWAAVTPEFVPATCIQIDYQKVRGTPTTRSCLEVHVPKEVLQPEDVAQQLVPARQRTKRSNGAVELHNSVHKCARTHNVQTEDRYTHTHLVGSEREIMRPVETPATCVRNGTYHAHHVRHAQDIEQPADMARTPASINASDAPHTVAMEEPEGVGRCGGCASACAVYECKRGNALPSDAVISEFTRVKYGNNVCRQHLVRGHDRLKRGLRVPGLAKEVGALSRRVHCVPSCGGWAAARGCGCGSRLRMVRAKGRKAERQSLPRNFGRFR